MPIKQVTPKKRIEKQIDTYLTRQEALLIRYYGYVGEKCLTEMREHGSYKDQTGNLRSSTGYVIVRNGQIVQSSGFAQIRDGSQGMNSGYSFAQKIAMKYRTGIALILVAGMKYAASVEAKGYNVISSAKLHAEKEISILMKKLGFRKK